MSNTSSLTLVPVEDEDLAEQVLRMRLRQGMSAQQIARKMQLPVREINDVLDTLLPTLDFAYRRRAIGEALLTLDAVIGQHMQNLKDPESCAVIIRSLTERRYWIGITQTAANDPIQMTRESKPAEHTYAPYERALGLVRQMQDLVGEEKTQAVTELIKAEHSDKALTGERSSADEPDDLNPDAS